MFHLSILSTSNPEKKNQNEKKNINKQLLSGVEVHGREYSFGFVEEGPGVYPCSPRKNPMYKYRETVELGTTAMAPAAVRALIAEMTLRWPGASYSLLTRNCVHFCEELCAGLGCTDSVPPWVNAAAAGADGAARAASAAAAAGRELAKGAREWLQGVASAVAAGAVAVAPEANGNGSGTGAAKR